MAQQQDGAWAGAPGLPDLSLRRLGRVGEANVWTGGGDVGGIGRREADDRQPGAAQAQLEPRPYPVAQQRLGRRVQIGREQRERHRIGIACEGVRPVVEFVVAQRHCGGAQGALHRRLGQPPVMAVEQAAHELVAAIQQQGGAPTGRRVPPFLGHRRRQPGRAAVTSRPLPARRRIFGDRKVPAVKVVHVQQRNPRRGVGPRRPQRRQRQQGKGTSVQQHASIKPRQHADTQGEADDNVACPDSAAFPGP